MLALKTPWTSDDCRETEVFQRRQKTPAKEAGVCLDLNRRPLCSGMPSRSSKAWILLSQAVFARHKILSCSVAALYRYWSVVGHVYHLQYVLFGEGLQACGTEWSTTLWCFLLLTGWQQQRKKNIWIPCVRCWRGWHLLSEETGNLIIDKIWSRSPGQWFCLWTLLTVRPLISSRSGSSDGPPALCLVHCYEQNTKMFDCETCCSGLWQQCSLCSIQKS